MEAAAVSKLLTNISFDEKKMDISLAEAFFQKHECHFRALTGDRFESKVSNTETDRKGNIVEMYQPDTPIIFPREWAELPMLDKCARLNRIADLVQSNSDLLGQIEFTTRGINPQDVKQFDVPSMVEYFRYYSCFCSLPLDKAMYATVYLTESSPLMSLGWFVAPALAKSIKTTIYTNANTTAIATLFAELCHEAGLEKSTVQVIPIDSISLYDDFYVCNFNIPLFYIGSPKLFGCYTLATENFIPYDFVVLNTNGSTMVVTESADLDSSIDVIFKAAWSHNGTLAWSLRRIIIQESVLSLFMSKLSVKLKMHRAKNGNFVDNEIVKNINAVVDSLSERGFKSFDIHSSFNEEGRANLLRPIIMTEDIPQPDKDVISKADVPLPIVLTQTYRTTKELLSMLNNDPPLALSVWCDKMAIANEIALGVETNCIWINNFGLFSPSVQFIGRGKNGFGHSVLQPVSDQLKLMDVLVREQIKENKPAAINAYVDSISKLQASWLAKTAEQRAQSYRSLTDKVTKRSDLIDLDNTVLEYLQNTMQRCHKPSTICTVFGKTMCYQVREPLGVIAVKPHLDTLLELITTVTEATILGNGVIYLTKSSSVIELCKEFSDSGIPVIPLITSDFSSKIDNNCIKKIWNLREHLLTLTDFGLDNLDDLVSTKIFEVIKNKELMEDFLSNLKSIWTTLGETFAN